MEVKRIRIVPFTGHIQPIVKDGYNCPPYGRYIKGVDQNIYPSDYDWKISAYVIQEQTFWGWKAVDFISWAIFRKYEKDDLTFYNIIKSKIIDERSLF